VGLIGDNGSGKTTLLKLIAGLYRPTSGEVHVSEPVTLLAGLGIGMVDELTVEHNVLLYGAIYGLDRAELRPVLPEILEWAELADFGQAKLKTLSTGMRSRLAFSAMRHVDAGVYLMDEVLSAGDIRFKAKCEAVFDGYRLRPATFVVATHDVKFVLRFCDKALWLNKGRTVAFGDPARVVEEYMSSRGGSADLALARPLERITEE
jgi:ABC-type polysaccharide/polyol phosphate transport system ATPase subunit